MASGLLLRNDHELIHCLRIIFVKPSLEQEYAYGYGKLILKILNQQVHKLE